MGKIKQIENDKIKCAYSELVDLHKLTPNPRNSNFHSEKQVAMLAKIIDHLGQRHPIIVSNRSKFIVAGHGRLLAMQKLGWEKCAVEYQDFDSEASEFSFLIADNKIAELAEHDDVKMLEGIKELQLENLDFELLGLDGFELPMEEIVGNTDADDTPELKKETIVKKGDVWLLGNHRLMCGDSTMIDDVEKLMNERVSDLLFTSPPYSDMRDYNGNKELKEDHLSEFFENYQSDYYVVNLGLKRHNNTIVPYWEIYLDRAKNNNLKLLAWNIWDKGESGSFANQQAMFPIEHEWLFIFGKERGNINKTEKTKHGGKNITMTVREKSGLLTPRDGGIVGEFKHHGSVFKQTTVKGKRDHDHPAAFPIGLVEKHLSIFSPKLVVDPFCGSGTTLIACEQKGVECFGMELDEKYCDVIVRRWQTFTGKTATLELTGEAYKELSE